MDDLLQRSRSWLRIIEISPVDTRPSDRSDTAISVDVTNQERHH